MQQLKARGGRQGRTHAVPFPTQLPVGLSLKPRQPFPFPLNRRSFPSPQPGHSLPFQLNYQSFCS